ncbi:MAG TPA: isoprenylcysteine carboxylmethyltransferase family protein, partial [Longimicrobiaceae bacterium]|nr:isoprenylcysteine carboxylmethyltransferase family protein [Longimicrobiaceae bacterium]
MGLRHDPALNPLAVARGWWSFAGGAAEMPVALLIGWVLLWGLLPSLALPRLPAWAAAALALWLDVMLMPRLAPVLRLGHDWLAGEALLIALGFVPARLLAAWTEEGQRLYGRVVLQVACFGALVTWTLPWAVEAAVRSQSPALDLRFAAPVSLGIALQVVALPALLGVAAVHEFATRGGGTPVPYDPPARLVRSGPYAYVANPMQLSAALVLATWGALTGRPWVMAIGAMSVFYSAGLAEADEAEDLRRRFGEPWAAYRRGVRQWLPRWRPWHPSLDGGPPDVLYVSAECGKCSELGRMIAAMRPVGLIVVPAEDHPSRDLLRITYAPADGGADEEGVAAFARALEHVNLSLALPAMAMRLPIIRPILQVIVDASGGGPMQVSRRRECAV